MFLGLDYLLKICVYYLLAQRMTSPLISLSAEELLGKPPYGHLSETFSTFGSVSD